VRLVRKLGPDRHQRARAGRDLRQRGQGG
jgi:hypothetical protein